MFDSDDMTDDVWTDDETQIEDVVEIYQGSEGGGEVIPDCEPYKDMMKTDDGFFGHAKVDEQPLNPDGDDSTLLDGNIYLTLGIGERHVIEPEFIYPSELIGFTEVFSGETLYGTDFFLENFSQDTIFFDESCFQVYMPRAKVSLKHGDLTRQMREDLHPYADVAEKVRKSEFVLIPSANHSGRAYLIRNVDGQGFIIGGTITLDSDLTEDPDDLEIMEAIAKGESISPPAAKDAKREEDALSIFDANFVRKNKIYYYKISKYNDEQRCFVSWLIHYVDGEIFNWDEIEKMGEHGIFKVAAHDSKDRFVASEKKEIKPQKPFIDEDASIFDPEFIKKHEISYYSLFGGESLEKFDFCYKLSLALEYIEPWSWEKILKVYGKKAFKVCAYNGNFTMIKQETRDMTPAVDQELTNVCTGLGRSLADDPDPVLEDQVSKLVTGMSITAKMLNPEDWRGKSTIIVESVRQLTDDIPEGTFAICQDIDILQVKYRGKWHKIGDFSSVADVKFTHDTDDDYCNFKVFEKEDFMKTLITRLNGLTPAQSKLVELRQESAEEKKLSFDLAASLKKTISKEGQELGKDALVKSLKINEETGTLDIRLSIGPVVKEDSTALIGGAILEMANESRES